MPMKAVKILSYEMVKYNAVKKANMKVGGIVAIKKERANVEYAFDFVPYKAPGIDPFSQRI